ncbi:replication factor C large subunit [Candidatus Woesearchaeota archaeon]|nr:replication factor C large subunit [Candidatus Woesearchaeota archaeon]
MKATGDESVNKSWTSLHTPKTSRDVVGQDRVVKELQSFILDFKKQKRKAALVWGPPGCGKTCIAHAIASEQQLEAIELNASDVRTGGAISQIIGAASQQMSLFSRGKILLIDEIDGISGSYDRGGVPELVKIIEETKFPIIMTANDPFDKKFSPLRKIARMIECDTLNTDSIFRMLSRIADTHAIAYDNETLLSLARRTGGDLRAAINDLQIIASTKGSVAQSDLAELSERERTDTIINALLKIFKTTDLSIAIAAFEHVDEELDECLLWLDENIPYEYEKPADLCAAYDWLAKANIMNARIRRWQHWRFLIYVGAYLSGGVAVSKDEKYKKFVQYRQSMRPLKIWQANMKYQKRKAIAEKIASRTHTSSAQAFANTFPYLKVIAQHNPEEIRAIADDIGLDESEVAYLAQ